MKWTDIYEIAESLDQCYPDVDPQYVLFTDLHKWVLNLDGFDDLPDHCNERILEAIQAAWIEERK